MENSSDFLTTYEAISLQYGNCTSLKQKMLQRNNNLDISQFSSIEKDLPLLILHKNKRRTLELLNIMCNFASENARRLLSFP